MLIPLFSYMTAAFYTGLSQSEEEGSEYTPSAFLGEHYLFLLLYNFLKPKKFHFYRTCARLV